MEENKVQRDILRRLDILICLLLDAPAAEKAASIASKVHKLSVLGLSASEIATIIGKPVNYVTAIKSAKRAREEGL